ncbi:hypothetical protein B0T16DRAFT_457915 [Cercophora newfieldiana]|uniref:Mesaconyl-C4 CoA hydratase n=1 Tax=Cercophora newfieldiana TaxID=92897 RepID=A0AA39Y4K6_9PEZI|nr:hypothetical protein B0T16DRAFT_457915 [Cercophora newfieldiana]
MRPRPNKVLAVGALTRSFRRFNTTDTPTTTTTTTTTPDVATADTTAPKAASAESTLSEELDEYLKKAKTRMAARKPKILIDPLSPMNSHLLDIALQDHLPRPRHRKPQDPVRLALKETTLLPNGHHLVYFPLQAPKSALQPDGTDPDHAPGWPFVRRMWAGGSVSFSPGLIFNPSFDTKGWCIESVGEPVLKRGSGPGDEKVFVEVKRQYGYAPAALLAELSPSKLLEKHQSVQMEEIRKLVFMRERGPVKVADGTEPAPPARIIKSNSKPQYSFTLNPDPTLLFQFSALTYNAHAIHLDPDYARNQEGYPERLVHGPLTLVLMLTALRRLLRRTDPARRPSPREPSKKLEDSTLLEEINYRNLAPLFVGQEIRVCVRETARKVGSGTQTWELWVEGPDGSLAVRGTATTRRAGVTAGRKTEGMGWKEAFDGPRWLDGLPAFSKYVFYDPATRSGSRSIIEGRTDGVEEGKKTEGESEKGGEEKV